LVLVTSRKPDDSLFHLLPPGSAIRVGDCLVPSSIADAVYSGHRCAREYGEDPQQLAPRRERTMIDAVQYHSGRIT
jgi:dimethylamine/trimethylamine dehydrogenase